MDKHCRGCRSHWAHGATNRYKDWCCKYSDVASKKVGHCKLHYGKELAA